MITTDLAAGSNGVSCQRRDGIAVARLLQSSKHLIVEYLTSYTSTPQR